MCGLDQSFWSADLIGIWLTRCFPMFVNVHVQESLSTFLKTPIWLRLLQHHQTNTLPIFLRCGFVADCTFIKIGKNMRHVSLWILLLTIIDWSKFTVVMSRFGGAGAVNFESIRYTIKNSFYTISETGGKTVSTWFWQYIIWIWTFLYLLVL